MSGVFKVHFQPNKVQLQEGGKNNGPDDKISEVEEIKPIS